MQSTLCIYAGCSRQVRSRGLCESHYRKWRYGSISVCDVPDGPISYNGAGCGVSDCQRDAVARGWCLKHYKRWMRHGDPTALPRPVSKSESFAARTQVGGAPKSRPGLGRCVEWTGALNHSGYGLFTHRPSGTVNNLAHRVALNLNGVSIPSAMVVDHLCRNRRCVNVSHLEVVSNEENLRRGWGYRLRNGMDNTCVNGHEYTPDNTYSNPNKAGDVRCIKCARNRGRKRSRKKAA